MDGQNGRISELPSSVVIGILTKLPIKALAQCRHVCKSWNAMLSEIYFYKLYSTSSPTTLMIQVKGYSLEYLRDIYVIEANDDSSIISRNVHINFESKEENDDDDIQTDEEEGEEEEDEDEEEEEEEEESCDDHPNFKYQLGNSCNGLICLRELRTREPIAIWNPIMGQYVNLPKPVSTSDEKVVAGFGFSPREKLYKVLRIFHEKETQATKWVAEVYDFGVNSSAWRRIRDAPCEIPSLIPGFFINSSLHWILGCATRSDPDQLICSFDFNSEGFRFIPPPPIFSVNKKKNHWSNLGILPGCLSICAIDANNFRADVEVWVMDEYGDPESWVKKLSIRDPAIDWWDPYRWIQVTNFLNNGEILLLCGHRYVLAYDPRARTFVNKEGLNFPAIAHVPSFISLKCALREDDPAALDVKYL